MSILAEKLLVGAARLASWAPNMDVIAMVSAEGQLCVYRLNWQRLWVQTCDEDVTALCWRPDGKLIAAGLADGSVSFHDVENGEVCTRRKLHAAAVCTLDWQTHAAAAHTQLRASLRRSGKSSMHPPAEIGASPALRLLDDDSSDRLHILCSGDVRGTCEFSAFGLFSVGRLDVRSLLRCGGSTTETHPLDVLKAELSSDFMRLNVVVAEQLSAVRYISIATPLLHSRAPELLLLARSGYRVQVMLEAGQGCILSCARELSDANAALSEKLAALKSLLRDHASDSSPEDELLSLLSTGVASAAVNQFLSVTLGVGGLKRLAKSMDAAFAAIQSTLLDQLQPALEYLLLHICELQGLATWQERASPIGLAGEAAASCQAAAEGTLTACSQAARACFDAACSFRNLFLWLQRCQRRLNDDGSTASDASKMPAADLARVNSFLAGGVCTDVLAVHFVPLHDAADVQGGRLAAEAASLSSSCARLFDAVPLSASATFQISASPVLLLSTASHVCAAPVRMRNAAGMDFACAVASCTGGDGEQQHVCLTRRRIGLAADGPSEALLLKLAANERIVDVQFYREARMAMLLRDAQGACRLEEVDCAQLPCIMLDRADGNALSECEDRGAVIAASTLSDDVYRCMMQLPGVDATAPLALGSRRGLACAFVDQTRGVLIDLEAAGDEED